MNPQSSRTLKDGPCAVGNGNVASNQQQMSKCLDATRSYRSPHKKDSVGASPLLRCGATTLTTRSLKDLFVPRALNPVEKAVRIAVPPCFRRIALLVACATASLIGISCESQSQQYRSRDGAPQRSTRGAGTAPTALPKRPDQSANHDDDDARQRFWDNYNESRAMKEK